MEEKGTLLYFQSQLKQTLECREDHLVPPFLHHTKFKKGADLFLKLTRLRFFCIA